MPYLEVAARQNFLKRKRGALAKVLIRTDGQRCLREYLGPKVSITSNMYNKKRAGEMRGEGRGERGEGRGERGEGRGERGEGRGERGRGERGEGRGERGEGRGEGR